MGMVVRVRAWSGARRRAWNENGGEGEGTE
jgi:hypothetical protein